MAGSDEDRDATMALLWEERPVARRGPRPATSTSAIAAAGIALADAEGLAAVTMQRVAAALGFTKMALYRYVSSKDALVALMIEAGLGGPPAPSGDGWRARLESWTLQLFALFTAHPWTLEATVGDRVMGPNELGWLEAAVAALAGTGLDGGEQLDVAGTLAGHARAIAAQATATEGGNPERALDEMIAGLVQGRESRFPAIAAAVEAAVASGAQDQALTFGLHRILDGVEMLIAARRNEPAPKAR